jgi:hypothetical protein
VSKVKEWKWYTSGKTYNSRLEPDYYKSVETNIDFYNGNQWKNVRSNGAPTPVFNIIKRAINYFVSTLMSNKVTIQYLPMENREDEIDGLLKESDMATAEVRNLFGKFKMDNRIREALFDSAVTGDVAAHLYFNPDKKPYGGIYGDIAGEIEFELIDGTNVYVSNPNNSKISIDTQDWVIISARDTVENLKREAAYYMEEQEVEQIQEDSNTDDRSGAMGKIELEIEGDKTGKALYILIYKYDRKTGTVTVSKATENAYIYKDIDTRLSYYPIAWLNWEKQKNCYHGQAVCTSIIPNQIFVNRMFAMTMYHLMQSAFPKAIYDADKVTGWTNEIGSAIAVKNVVPGESLRNVATYLEPGNMSSQIVQVLQMAIDYTKEFLGVNDAMTGDINPERASGKAIISVVSQSIQPLENVKANLYEWIEDIGRIILDMMATYYGERIIATDTINGRELIRFNFEELKNIHLETKCEIGATSYWSELACIETLDNLFQQGAIDVIEYLETVPEGYIPGKEELIQKIKTRLAEAQAIQQETQAINQQAQLMPQM